MKPTRHDFLAAKKIIEQAGTIALASHIRPDGDALGSVLGLASGLEKMGKKVYPFLSDDTPDFLGFLPQLDRLMKPDPEMSVDLFIALDVSDTRRLGPAGALAEKAPHTMCIDHHVTNKSFAQVNLLDSTASATAQVVYDLMDFMGISITKDMATLLFTALSTDTGRFMYESCTPKTHRIAANLMEMGADTPLIFQSLYMSVDYKTMKMTNEIVDKAELLYEDRLIISIVTQDMLERHQRSMEDTEEVVNVLRDIDGVEVACFIKEYGKKEYKVSMRSKAYVNVAEISMDFNGGGHIHASGFTLYDTLDTALSRLKERFECIEWR